MLDQYDQEKAEYFSQFDGMPETEKVTQNAIRRYVGTRGLAVWIDLYWDNAGWGKNSGIWTAILRDVDGNQVDSATYYGDYQKYAVEETKKLADTLRIDEIRLERKNTRKHWTTTNYGANFQYLVRSRHIISADRSGDKLTDWSTAKWLN